jgi:hypothetical protein
MGTKPVYKYKSRRGGGRLQEAKETRGRRGEEFTVDSFGEERPKNREEN